MKKTLHILQQLVLFIVTCLLYIFFFLPGKIHNFWITNCIFFFFFSLSFFGVWMVKLSPPSELKGSIKVGLWASKNISFYLLQWNPFKYHEKYFLFHLKNSFCSQNTWIFVLTCMSRRRNALIRKIRLISKFLTSEPG